MNDIVLYAKDGENEEMRYAIRTWCENLTFRHLYAVGGPYPQWFKPDKVIHNPVHLSMMKQYHESLVKALSDDSLTDDVVIMMDDIFIIGRVGVWAKNYNRGTLVEQVQRSNKETEYNRLVLHTDQYLKRHGISSPLSFEEHAPFVCNRRQLLKVLKDIEWDCGKLLWRSIYGNLYGGETTFRSDIKYHNRNDRMTNVDKIISTNEQSWRGGIGATIQDWYPVRSKYEK